jgi:prefoldin subunit 5
MNNEVYLVKSIRVDDLMVEVTQNLKVFSDFDRAEDFLLKMKEQIVDHDSEWLMIESFLLE